MNIYRRMQERGAINTFENGVIKDVGGDISGLSIEAGSCGIIGDSLKIQLYFFFSCISFKFD